MGLKRRNGVGDDLASVPFPRGEHAEIVGIIEPLRRFARAHATTVEDADDVVQEVLAKLLDLDRELDVDSTLAYALVMARNLITDRGRGVERARRNGHRLIDLREPVRPDEVAVE